MSVFIADHTGQIDTASSTLRPIHVGAALAAPEAIGTEPDTATTASLSALTVFADLRLYDYVAKTYGGQSAFVCIQQYRRQFFLGSPRPWQRGLRALQRRAAQITEGQVEITESDRSRYLRHLRSVSDATLRDELGRDDFIANRWSFGDISVEDQYLRSIADLYPGQDEYIDAWYDMRAVLGGMARPRAVERAFASTWGYFNNCFVTTWDEFDRYRQFLFTALDDLQQYRSVHRLYGYLAERIFNAYAIQRTIERGDFTIRSKAMLFTQ